MLFNSYIFIFCFLPIVFAGVSTLLQNKRASDHVLIWLLATSLVFYAYWQPIYLLLLFTSVLVNYRFGLQLARNRQKGVLWAALIFNLGLLIYFKYNNFVLSWFDIQSEIQPVLPLAISFFTFQQIAFLVDAYRGKTEEPSFLRYSLFVSFFPQLIAGPIVRHQEIRHQLSSISLKRDYITFGAITFIIGLAKKLIIADQLSQFTTYFFQPAMSHDFLSGWLAALCFGFEIYFDFSAYSDMAIGLARMLGIQFPENFNSPYQSTSMIDFWRRWHITLSSFLRDYLYIPLGGNRKGTPHQMLNLMATMVLGGLWHGANWTFVIWGALHGLFLIINHAWRHIQKMIPIQVPSSISFFTSWLLTFSCSIFAFVIFKADSLQTALNIWKGMLCLNGLVIPTPHRYRPMFEFLDTMGVAYTLSQPNLKIAISTLLVLACTVIIWCPNTAQIIQKISKRQTLLFRPAYLALLSALCLLFLNEHSPFIYFVF